MSPKKVCPYSFFQWNKYSWGLWMSFKTTDHFSVKVAKSFSRIGVSWTHSLPLQYLPLFWLIEMAILSKASKPDNFESHNSLKFSFSFKPVEVLVLFSLDVNLSLNQILLTFSWQTSMTQLILPISLRGLIFL